MGFDPISIGLVGLGALEGYQQLAGGRDAERKYKEIADEEIRAAQVQEVIARERLMEEQKDLTIEGRQARGSIKAAAAKSGLRMGGSVGTLMASTLARVERRKMLLGKWGGMEITAATRAAEVRADQYRSAGRSARVAGQRQGLTSLLTGTYSAGKRNVAKGRNWWDFSSGYKSSLGSTGGMSGLSGQGYWMNR
jgi:hypothetical protein